MGYAALILGIFCLVFSIVQTIYERKLIFSRKAVTGADGFSSAIISGIIGASGIQMLTNSYLYALLFLAGSIAAYVITCFLVQKIEYPPEGRFTKE